MVPALRRSGDSNAASRNSRTNSGYMRALAAISGASAGGLCGSQCAIMPPAAWVASRPGSLFLDDQHAGAITPQAPGQRQSNDSPADDHHVPSLHEFDCSGGGEAGGR